MSSAPDANGSRTSLNKPEAKEATSTSYEAAPSMESGSDKAVVEASETQNEKIAEEETKKLDESEDRLPLTFRQNIARVRFVWWWALGAVVLGIPVALGATILKNTLTGSIHFLELFVWLEVVWAGFWLSYFVAWAIGSAANKITEIEALDIGDWDDFFNDLRLPMTLIYWTIVIWATIPVICDLNDGDCSSSWEPLLRKIALATLVVAAIFFVKSVCMELLYKKVGSEFLKPRMKSLERSLKALLILLIKDPDGLAGCNLPTYKRLWKAVCEWFGLSLDNGIWDWICAIGVHPLEDEWEENWDKYTKGKGDPEYYYAVLALIWRSFDRSRGSVDPLTTKELTGRLQKHKEAKKYHFADKFKDVGDLMELLDADDSKTLSVDEIKFLATEVGEGMRSVCKGIDDVAKVIGNLNLIVSVLVLIGTALVYAAFFTKDLSNYLTPLWTTFTGLSFALSGTVQEFLSACILLFIKHPYDGGDRIIFNSQQLIVVEITLMHTVFRRATDDTLVQISHSDLATGGIENLSRTLSQSVDKGQVFNDSVEVMINPRPRFGSSDLDDAKILNKLLTGDEIAKDPVVLRYFRLGVKLVWVPDKDTTQRSLQIEFKNEKRLIRADETKLAENRRKIIQRFYEIYDDPKSKAVEEAPAVVVTSLVVDAKPTVETNPDHPSVDSSKTAT